MKRRGSGDRRALLLGEVIKGSRSSRRRRKLRLGPYGAMMVTALIGLAAIDAAALTYAEVSYRGGVLAVKDIPSAPTKVENLAVVLTRPDRSGAASLDSVVLIHVPPKGRPVAVHMPPELRVRLPSGKTGRLVDAYALGMDDAIGAVSNFTRLRFDVVSRVKLDSISELTRAVGGVALRSNARIRIGRADIGDACREPDPTAINDLVISEVSGTSLERMQRIQTIVSASAGRASSRVSWLNPIRVIGQARATKATMKVTTKGSLSSYLRWAKVIAQGDSSAIDLRTVPVSEPAARIQGVNFVIANDRQTRALFDAMEQGQPLPPFGRSDSIAIEPSDVGLTVLNGTLAEGLAKKVAKDLADRGFIEAPTTNAPAHETTIVYFRPGNEQKARLVASRFGLDVREVTPDIPSATDVTMVIGQDYVRGTIKLLTEAQATAGSRTDRKPALLQACDE